MDVTSRLREEFGLADVEVDRLRAYVELVRKAPVNLTAWSDRQLWSRGIGESLHLRQWLRNLEPGYALDIGSGAGFPGLVLAITGDAWAWTLVEARERRGQFLRNTVDDLGLRNVRVVVARAEEWIYREPLMRARFVAVSMRAVARAAVSLELGLPYVARGGLFFLAQSETGYAELLSRGTLLESLGGQVQRREPTVTIVQKIAETPIEYPRSAQRLGR
jgi:16S rRNA (guanine527-N7)-methyltransferase